MDAIKVWGISTCTVLIIASIVSMIAPNISGKNIIRLIISGFILVGILSSLYKLIKNEDFSFSEVDTSALNQEVSYSESTIRNLTESVVQSLYPLVSDELEKSGMSEGFGLNVELQEKEDGIAIKKVHISISDKHKNNIENLKLRLEQNLGLKIDFDVVNTEGN